MNNREMLEALHALSELAAVKMPIKTGLKVRAAMRSLGHLEQDIEEERKKLIALYAVKNEDGTDKITDMGNGQGRYDFGDNLAKFDSEYNELMNLDCAGMPAAIKAQELGEIDVAPSLLMRLGELLVDE